MKDNDFPLLSDEGVSSGPITVRLARNEEELKASQKLRYDVFYREYGATPIADMADLGRDYDDFDDYAHHLIVFDTTRDGLENQVVGTYRMMSQDAANRLGQFYTDDEFDISSLKIHNYNLLELGRSCIHADYRTKPVLQLLWQGIAAYVSHYRIDLMFGCASFQGTNVQEIAESLSYLHHYHRAPDDLCPRALEARYVDMNLCKKDDLDAKKILMSLPSLLKGYLRVGCYIGNGAIIDHQFNTIDVCVVFKTEKLAGRYNKHFSRKIGAPIIREAEVVNT